MRDRQRERRGAADARRKAFTLIEIALALAITLVLAAIALPAYHGYVERARVRRTMAEIRMIEARVADYEAQFEVYPPDLAAVGADGMRDPWGNPYQYLRIDGPKIGKGKGKDVDMGKVRKDKNLVPINSDYDLYSMGPDGDSKPPLTAKASHDDIIRANDGGFVGSASEY